MQLTRHAIEKCETYEVDAAAVLSAMRSGETFLDLHRGGAVARLFRFRDRPWVAVLNPVTNKVVTVYPTDQRTVKARRRSGRWMVAKR